MKFENSAFAIDLKEEGGCRVVLKIDITADEVKKAHKQAVKAINKEISIPGFRKGKAPDQTVLSKYGSHIEKEWKEILLNEALRKAFELTDCYPLNKHSIEKPTIDKCSLEEGAVIRVAYESYPRVPTIDFATLKLPHIEKAPVSEERLQEILTEIQKSHADWEKIEGRSIQEGDYADLTIDAIDENPPKSIAKDRRFEVASGKMASWLKNVLIGHKEGDVLEATSELDPEASESVKATFRPTRVQIHIHSHFKILPAPLDDELAKKVGATSVDDLRAKIHANLEQEAESALHHQRLAKLDDLLLENYPFEVPATLVEQERESLLRRRIQALQQQNLSEEEIAARQKEIEKGLDSEVERSLRLFFLERQLIEQGKISVSNQEVNDELAQQIYQNPARYRDQMNDKEKVRQLVSRTTSLLTLRKAKEYALSQVISA